MRTETTERELGCMAQGSMGYELLMRDELGHFDRVLERASSPCLFIRDYACSSAGRLIEGAINHLQSCCILRSRSTLALLFGQG